MCPPLLDPMCMHARGARRVRMYAAMPAAFSGTCAEAQASVLRAFSRDEPRSHRHRANRHPWARVYPQSPPEAACTPDFVPLSSNIGAGHGSIRSNLVRGAFWLLGSDRRGLRLVSVVVSVRSANHCPALRNRGRSLVRNTPQNQGIFAVLRFATEPCGLYCSDFESGASASSATPACD